VKNPEFLVEILKEEVKEAEKLIRNGLNTKKIKKKLRFKELKVNFLKKEIIIDKNEIIELAKGLIYAKKNKNFKFIFVKEKDAKFIFDKKVAEKRANYLRNFLKDKEFADLSCGYAIQSLEFLNYSKRALLIDNDLKTLFYAYLNSILQKKEEKVEFLNLDSNKVNKEIKEKIKKLDFIYFEPYRDKNIFSPNFDKIIWYNERVIADLPKSFSNKISFLSSIEDEKGVNRITYFKNINVNPFYIVKRRKNVFLFEGERKELKEMKEEEFLNKLKEKEIVYEYYESAYFLNLVSPVLKLKRSYLGFENNHVKNKFKLLKIVKDLNSLFKEKKNNNLKVFLRYSLDPKEYYKEKEFLEKKLDFEGEIHIFKIKDSFVILKKI